MHRRRCDSRILQAIRKLHCVEDARNFRFSVSGKVIESANLVVQVIQVDVAARFFGLPA